ncbi:hypothetical protein C9994_08365 [Marivirga lumbricoides]|uniref:Uncharacterized protein n=1 Tax=Marivirga lumbricoides TaxID=1046115 RepID=A0A2T4DQX8_9BACT|nr:hypothetical protein C9994_08365 [Marivirga lumbricoides]
MDLNSILSGWQEYDDRKKKGVDARFFSCSEDWEVEYLIQKIRKANPQLSEGEVYSAIRECCRTIEAPRPRKEFVACVIAKLKLKST